MSYADSLSEHDEILTYEEGRLQGMKDLKKWMHVIRDFKLEHLLQAIREQQTLVDGIRGEEE